jgi:ABC-type nitrate/sulfonate/bicarbonate transport system substrate-binding protein
LSGPKGEFGAEYTPASTGQLQMMRDFAEANPQVAKGLAAALADLGKAIDERPAEVKAVIAKLHPDLDAKTLDFLFPTESLGWNAKPPTAKDIAHDIAFTKLTGAPLPQIDSINPASMIFP